MRKPFVDENGIQAFHVGKADELVDGSVVADITFEFRVGISPFFSAEAEIVESRFTFNYVEFGRIKLLFYKYT